MPPSVSSHDARRSASVTLRAVGLLSFVLGIIFVILFASSDSRGIAELQRARKRVDDLKADINRLDADNRRLRSEIESVKKSTFAVERIAREDLGMSKQGEVIYVLPAKPVTR
jgi:cell division protein FtsB